MTAKPELIAQLGFLNVMPKLVLARRQSRKEKVSLEQVKLGMQQALSHMPASPSPTEDWKCVPCRRSHPDKVESPRLQYLETFARNFQGSKPSQKIMFLKNCTSSVLYVQPGLVQVVIFPGRDVPMHEDFVAKYVSKVKIQYLQ